MTELRTRGRIVESSGPTDAAIVVIGEALGRHEERKGTPFVGPAGDILNKWITRAGLARQDIYVTNWICRRPQDNEIDSIPLEERREWTAALHERIATLDSPHVLAPHGTHALKALMGHEYSGVSKWRGSVLWYTSPIDKRTIKVVPVLHPAAIMRQPRWQPRSWRDWHTIAREATDPTRVVRHEPRATLCVWPDDVSGATLKNFIKTANKPDTILSIDIETSRAGEITCVGFATNDKWAIVFDTQHGRHSRHEECWQLIRILCESASQKLTQKGLYDRFWLSRLHGIELRNHVWDTHSMHHVLDPLDAHDLAYICSITIGASYWKHERKSDDRITQLQYNAKDVCFTWGAWARLYKTLTRHNRLTHYFEHYADVFDVAHRMMVGGIRLDSAMRETRCTQLQGDAHELHTRLDTLSGLDTQAITRGTQWLNAIDTALAASGRVKGETSFRKALRLERRSTKDAIKAAQGSSIFSPKGGESPLKLRSLLYDRWRIPARHKHGAVTADADALRNIRLALPRLAHKLKHTTPQDVAAFIDALMRHRQTSKLASTFLSARIEDTDGYVRTELKLYTDTGRFKSGTNPMGRGTNLQNQPVGDAPMPVRDLYLPDPGHVWLKIDLSQAENRVVNMLTGDPRAIERAQSHPDVFDEHRYMAHVIFEKPERSIAKVERTIGKRARHAKNYGMGPGKLQAILLGMGILRSFDECARYLQRIDDAEPCILEWQQRTRWTVMRHRALSNSWGSVVKYTHDRLDDELYRQAYAWVPSSEVAALLRTWGLLALDEWLHTRLGTHDGGQWCTGYDTPPRILTTVYDEIDVSCTPAAVYDVAAFLVRSLERPRVYNGHELTIPCSIAIGTSWHTSHEWSRLPSREELTSTAHELLETTEWHERTGTTREAHT